MYETYEYEYYETTGKEITKYSSSKLYPMTNFCMDRNLFIYLFFSLLFLCSWFCDLATIFG